MAGEGSAAARARLEAVAARARPVALAREHVLPVLGPLEPLLPGGLTRGTTVAVPDGSTSLALALVAGPSAAGSWVAAAGCTTLGLAAAAGYGVALDRLVVVAAPPPEHWASVVATLVDAFDVVLVRPPRRLRAADARRLAARTRERGAVLVVSGPWPEAPELRVDLVESEWQGLGAGHGHLHARRVTVEASGRRGAGRPRRAELWLPAPGGGVETAPPPPVPFRSRRPDPDVFERNSVHGPGFRSKNGESA